MPIAACAKAWLLRFGVFVSVIAPAVADDTIAARQTTANGLSISIESGASYLRLPERSFVGITSGCVGSCPLIEFLKSGINDSWDWRTDVVVDGIAIGGLGTIGIRGFYSQHEASGAVRCVGFNCGAPVVTGIGGFVGGNPTDTNERSEVEMWGISAFLRPWGGRIGGWSPKVGVGYRRIEQDQSAVFSAGLPVHITSETLTVEYYSGFIGADGRFALGHGFVAVVDIEAGLAHGSADYVGRSTQLLVPAPVAQVNLSEDQWAFIGTLKLDLERDFGPFRLALTQRGELISWVPAIVQPELARPVLLANDHAWSYTIGARLTVPLQQSGQ